MLHVNSSVLLKIYVISIKIFSQFLKSRLLLGQSFYCTVYSQTACFPQFSDPKGSCILNTNVYCIQQNMVVCKLSVFSMLDAKILHNIKICVQVFKVEFTQNKDFWEGKSICFNVISFKGCPLQSPSFNKNKMLLFQYHDCWKPTFYLKTLTTKLYMEFQVIHLSVHPSFCRQTNFRRLVFTDHRMRVTTSLPHWSWGPISLVLLGCIWIVIFSATIDSSDAFFSGLQWFTYLHGKNSLVTVPWPCQERRTQRLRSSHQRSAG